MTTPLGAGVPEVEEHGLGCGNHVSNMLQTEFYKELNYVQLADFDRI